MSAVWQPTAGFQTLRLRAQLLSEIRQFFAERSVWEVETPLLCHTTGTDPQLDFFASQYHCPPNNPTFYLQTSPEFAMKRLLAAGSGSIYQICKAFRNGEAGRYHNPEFTILEWYRVGFDLQALMDEVVELLIAILTPFLSNDHEGLVFTPADDRQFRRSDASSRFKSHQGATMRRSYHDFQGNLSIQQTSYQDIVKQLIGLDPLVFDRQAYQQAAIRLHSPEAEALCGDDHALWLDFLFSHHVQTALPQNTICLVYGYPAIQSSLARIHPEDVRVSERFEVFINGMELGNGFFELQDADEQARRFATEIEHRRALGLADVAMDQRFLQALQAGLPDCSGVAIGLDRLLMIATGCESIEQVLAFPFNRA